MRLDSVFSHALLAPQGVAATDTVLAIADTGHHEVVLVDAANLAAAPVARLGGLGTDAAAEGMLFPAAVTFLAADRLAVADTQNTQLDFYRSVAGAWQYDGNLANFAGLAPAPAYLLDVVVDPAGTLLALDAQRRRILSIDTAAGTAAVYLEDPAWSEPVVLAAAGAYLWVADTGLHQVFRYDAGLNSMRIGGFGTRPGELRAPRGVDYDPQADRLYVAEADNARISVFDSAGTFIETTALPPGTLHDPQRLRLGGNGSLYLADAAANLVYRFDTAAQGAVPSLSRRRLDFGAVGIGYRLPLSVSVRNQSNALLQVQGAIVVGDGFRLDLVAPATPFSVAAGGSAGLTVAFSPQLTGLAAGQLRVATDDPTANLLLADLIGEGLVVEPMAMALVLDRSGSMSQSSGAVSKIERLRAVSTMMTDLISENALDELTLVAFSTAAAVGLPLSTLSPANVGAAQGVIAGLTASGATSIGGGLSLALGQLAGSTLQRRNVIVLSDGMENTPPMITDVPIPAGTRIFTVGVGLAALLDVAKLEALATENGGYVQVTDGNDEQLAKFFTQIASDVFGQQIAVDPVLTMRRGHAEDIPVDLGDADYSATIVLTWDDPNAVYDFALVSPSGAVLGPAALTWVKQGPRHVIGKLHLRGSRWYRPGRWVVRVTPHRMSRATAAVVVSVAVATDIHASWMLTGLRERPLKARPPDGATAHVGPITFPAEPLVPVTPAGLHRGDRLAVEVELTWPGAGARLVAGQAVVRSPRVSLHELSRQFAGIDLDQVNQRDLRGEHDALVRRLAAEHGEKNRPTRRMYKARASRDRPSLTFQLPLSGPDGIYDVLLRVQGLTAAGNSFQRERSIHVLVRS